MPLVYPVRIRTLIPSPDISNLLYSSFSSLAICLYLYFYTFIGLVFFKQGEDQAGLFANPGLKQ